MLHLPAHGLIPMPCLEVQLLPCKRVLSVELVRAFRVARISVHRDSNEVARYRVVAGVAKLSTLCRSIESPVVVQLGVVMLNDQAGRLLDSMLGRLSRGSMLLCRSSLP